MRRFFALAAALFAAALCLAQAPKASVQYGPWIQNVTETGFTVIFKTPAPTLAYVEVAPDDGASFYNVERPRFYETVAGRRVSGTMHRIRISGLEPGKAYRYRVHGRQVIDDSSAYGTVWGPEGVIAKEVRGIRTLDKGAERCRFSAVNDMHAKYGKFAGLTKDLKPEDLDFFVMNGDIVSYVNSIDTMMKYTFGPARELLRRVPSIYVRGNHESRGREFDKVPSLFDTPTGEFYFQFRQGPCAFLVLDGGEDKPDSSGEYSGTAAYDAYRQAELEWLKEAVRDPDFVSAPWRIVLIHIPTISHIEPWYAQQWLCDNFLPVLNEAGVDLMLSGHHHKYIYTAPGAEGNANTFPILVNSNVDRLDFTADASSLDIRIIDPDGKEIHRHSYKK
jgi:hypothetical protein